MVSGYSYKLWPIVPCMVLVLLIGIITIGSCLKNWEKNSKYLAKKANFINLLLVAFMMGVALIVLLDELGF